MRYGRIEDNIVVEIISPMDGFAIEDCYVPAIVATLYPIADDVQNGWIRQEDGRCIAPVIEEEVIQPEPVLE